jgi:hypothetical protein
LALAQEECGLLASTRQIRGTGIIDLVGIKRRHIFLPSANAADACAEMAAIAIPLSLLSLIQAIAETRRCKKSSAATFIGFGCLRRSPVPKKQ